MAGPAAGSLPAPGEAGRPLCRAASVPETARCRSARPQRPPARSQRRLPPRSAGTASWRREPLLAAAALPGTRGTAAAVSPWRRLRPGPSRLRQGPSRLRQGPSRPDGPESPSSRSATPGALSAPISGAAAAAVPVPAASPGSREDGAAPLVTGPAASRPGADWPGADWPGSNWVSADLPGDGARPVVGARLGVLSRRELLRRGLWCLRGDTALVSRRPGAGRRRPCCSLAPVRPAGDLCVHGPHAVMTVKKRGQPLSLLGSDAEDDPGLTPWIFQRVAHVARHRRRRICAQAVHDTPATPCPLQGDSRSLSLLYQVRITHRASPLPSKAPHAPARRRFPRERCRTSPDTRPASAVTHGRQSHRRGAGLRQQVSSVSPRSAIGRRDYEKLL